MESVWQVEIDEKARETLSITFPEAIFPNIERFTDVRECKGLKSVDIVAGGFPCQDLSVAGRRAGLNGERSGLWFEFHRILADVKPRWVVVENVPGLLSSHKGRDFAVILRGLVELGYGVCWRVLDAQYFGLAQRRKRVFIVGSLGDYSCLQVLFESEGVSGDPPESRKAGTEVAHTLRSRTQKNSSMAGQGGEDDYNIIPDQQVATPITATMATTKTPNDTQTGRPSNLIVFQQNQRDEVRVLGDVAGALQSQPGMKQQNYVAASRLDRVRRPVRLVTRKNKARRCAAPQVGRIKFP